MPNPIGRMLRNRHAGESALAWARPGLQAPTFTLTSPAFAHEAPMPERYKGRLRGANVSPALEWSGVPDTAVELVLIAEDRDVPFSKAALHALARGIDPALGGIPDDGLADPSPVPGLVSGRGALGRRGWSGPMPIPSHGPHSYVFQLFAVDRALDLPAGFRLAELFTAIKGHVVARARLDGTYEVA
jgi:Raf kinase inhibitor-like YbhB/YbcL family protein